MSRRERDIKAPDGFLLGGLRRVHKDGTVLFQRGYWQCPMEWAGEKVWVHEWQGSGWSDIGVEAWPPGIRIWTTGAETLLLARTKRPDAKAGFRTPWLKEYAERLRA